MESKFLRDPCAALRDLAHPFGLFAVACLAAWAVVSAAEFWRLESAPCEAFRASRLADVPARCLPGVLPQTSGDRR